MSRRKGEKERDISVVRINISKEIFSAFYRVNVHRANRAINLFEEARILPEETIIRAIRMCGVYVIITLDSSMENIARLT